MVTIQKKVFNGRKLTSNLWKGIQINPLDDAVDAAAANRWSVCQLFSSEFAVPNRGSRIVGIDELRFAGGSSRGT